MDLKKGPLDGISNSPVATVGDETCALHALLGRHVFNGRIVCAPDGVTALHLDECTASANAESHRLEMQRGDAVYDLIQQRNLCPEGSDFFRE